MQYKILNFKNRFAHVRFSVPFAHAPHNEYNIYNRRGWCHVVGGLCMLMFRLGCTSATCGAQSCIYTLVPMCVACVHRVTFLDAGTIPSHTLPGPLSFDWDTHRIARICSTVFGLDVCLFLYMSCDNGTEHTRVNFTFRARCRRESLLWWWCAPLNKALQWVNSVIGGGFEFVRCLQLLASHSQRCSLDFWLLMLMRSQRVMSECIFWYMLYVCNLCPL